MSLEDLNRPRQDAARDVGDLSELRRAPVPGIEATPDSVKFLGVELAKCKGGPNTPDIAMFDKDAITKMDLKLMQEIAALWGLDQIPCIEGGPGIGKTHTVQRMGAYLNQEVFKVVCDPETLPSMLLGKVTTNPRSASGFGFVPGIATEAMERGGILFLDEYNALPHETKLRMRDVFDALSNGQRTFLLKENSEQPGGVKITIHPDFRVIMAQNEPDGSSPILHPLPEPDFSRVAYMKYPEKLPDEIEEARFLGQLGMAPEITLTEDDYLHRNPDFSREKLAEILGGPEGMREYYRMYKDFTTAVETLVDRMEIGRDQSQPVTFNAQRDSKRVLEFVTEFYDGDLQATTQKALRLYFENRFEDPMDRARVGELIEKFQIDTAKAPDRVQIDSVVIIPASNDKEILEEAGASPKPGFRHLTPELEAISVAIGEIKPLERLIVGRDPREIGDGSLSADILKRVSPHMSWVSRQHAVIEMGPTGNVTIKDLGSTYGTEIRREGGDPIRVGDSPVPLRAGDIIVLGPDENSVIEIAVPELRNKEVWTDRDEEKFRRSGY